MKRTTWVRIVMALSLVLPLSGCWDKIEVKELGIVMGIGLDYADGDQPIQLTLQTVKPSAGQNGEPKGNGSTKAYETYVIRGETVFDAFDQIDRISYKKIVLPHSKLIVIGKSLAEHGIAEISDYLLREKEIRPTSWLIVAESTAKEVLEGDLGTGSIPSSGLVTMLENLKSTSMAHPTNLTQFYMNVQGDTAAAVAPYVNKEGGRIKFESTAVFRKDRMVGTLNVNETRGLLWLEDRLFQGNATFPYMKGKSSLKKNVSVEIQKGHTRITPVFQAPDTITMVIECSASSHIRETEVQGAVLFEPEIIEDLEKAVVNLLTTRIQHTIDVAQKEMKTDFVGFADKFHNDYPSEWNRLKKDWKDVFPRIQTRITVNIEIDRQGITKNPIEI
ncbi:Ger(x)C family spore germination protein [Gorillibacterium sp. sgz5001074]|uniref:Ger(x)C family spore germination protein n=1 Tax=Gorillibacterium sp. sgz5001074 TaxID=3446695 RepID=UPI003F66F506